jgi:putative hydrolase of the HAD superfamily
MISAVIFDCYGVLTTDGWLEFCDANLKDPLQRALARDLLHQHDKGFISLTEFATQAAELTHVSSEELEHVISNHDNKNEPLLAYIAELKTKGLKIGMLSNVGEDWLNHFLTAAERALFDDILLSYKVNLTKPDPLIYQMAVDRLEMIPQQCVFVDDRQGNIDGAMNIDMQGILYNGFDSFKQSLEALLAR